MHLHLLEYERRRGVAVAQGSWILDLGYSSWILNAWYTELEACVDVRAAGHHGERAVSLLYNIFKLPFDEQFSFPFHHLHLPSSSLNLLLPLHLVASLSSNLLLPLHPVVSLTSRLPGSTWVNHCYIICIRQDDQARDRYSCARVLISLCY